MRPTGIDVGKHALHVCIIPEDSPQYKKWPVRQVDMTAGWQRHLRTLVPQDAVVALEPTGWHYSLPVLRSLQDIGAQVLTVGHSTSKMMRAMHFPSKTDANDARTLAIIARDWARGTLYEGVSAYDHRMTGPVAELRTLIMLYRSAKRQIVRLQNRFRSYAHAVDPALSARPDTYKRAIRAGAVWPDEIRALAVRLKQRSTPVPGYEHGVARNALYNLVPDLADLPPLPEALRTMLAEAVQDQDRLQARVLELEEQLTRAILAEPIRHISNCWLSVPGAGVYRVAVLHAATYCRPELFTSDEFKAALGAHPNRFSSGEMNRSKNTQKGYRPAKGELHLWAMSLLSKGLRPNPVAAYYDGLVERNHKHALPATRAKLARILSGIARNGTTWKP